MKIIGYAKIKDVLLGAGTRCGDDGLYLGHRLRVLDRTESGDCLVINHDGSGIGDVSACDIESYQSIEIPKTGNAFFDDLMQRLAARV